MTPKQARDFIAKYPNAKSFVKPSHLEELSPLFEVHIEAIICRKDEFHDLPGGVSMPRKETLDKFAAAAGVSYNGANESTRKEGEGCYVGRSQAMVVGPDGKMILGDVCEYEFDVDVRLEELKLNGKADWEHKNGNRPGRREYTDIELAQERIQLWKVARQRANTGARNRATVSILGMQTGFKGLFQSNDPDTKTVTFLFSRIIVNAKNELVMNRMLDGIAGNAAALFGPQAVTQLAAPAVQATPEEPRDVTHSADEAPDDFNGAPGFDEPPAADPEATAIAAELNEWAQVTEERIAWRAKKILDSGEGNLKVLKPAIEIIRYLGKGGKKGSKECATALDMSPLDPVILADLAGKVRGIQVPA